MNKLVASILALTVCVSVTGCSSNQVEEAVKQPVDFSQLDFEELTQNSDYVAWLGKHCSESTIRRNFDNLELFSLPESQTGDIKATLASRAKRLKAVGSDFQSLQDMADEVINWDSKNYFAWLDPKYGAETLITEAFAESFYALSKGDAPKASATQAVIEDWVSACQIQSKIDTFFASNAEYINAVDNWRNSYQRFFTKDGYEEYTSSSEGLKFMTKIEAKGSSILVHLVHYNKNCSISDVGLYIPGAPDLDGITGPAYDEYQPPAFGYMYSPETLTFEVDDPAKYQLDNAALKNIICD